MQRLRIEKNNQCVMCLHAQKNSSFLSRIIQAHNDINILLWTLIITSFFVFFYLPCILVDITSVSPPSFFSFMCRFPGVNDDGSPRHALFCSSKQSLTLYYLLKMASSERIFQVGKKAVLHQNIQTAITKKNLYELTKQTSN